MPYRTAPTLSTEELNQIARELEAAETQWLRVQAAVNETMQCPECGGRGAVALGSLGDFCVECEGTGVIDSPFETDAVTLPTELQEIKTRYLADRAMDDDLTEAKKVGVAQALLPPAPEGRAKEIIAKIRGIKASATVAGKSKVAKQAKPLLDAKDAEIAELKRKLAAASGGELAAGDVEDLNDEA